MKQRAQKIWQKFNTFTTPVKVVILIVFCCTLWMLTGALKNHNHNKDNGGAAHVALKSIDSVAEIRQKKLKVNGVTAANKLVLLRAEIEGRVLSRVEPQGTFLKKGSPIILLDPKNSKESLQEKKSNLDQKTVVYHSTQQLYKKGLSSKAGIAQATADYKQAQSDYKAALIRSNDAVITAPFDGILDTIYVDEGTLISTFANIDLCRFLSIDPIKVQLNIPEKDISYAKTTKEAMVYTLNHKKYDGKVSFLSNAAEPSTRAFLMEIEIENKKHELLAGESVYVVLAIGEFKTHKLPRSAITINLAGDIVVKTIEHNKVVTKIIDVIDEQTGEVWVTGLSDKEKVIIMGSNLVADGQEL